MVVPVGLNVWSRLVDQILPYLDHAAGPWPPPSAARRPRLGA